jgi:hypothetical protein
VTESGNGKLRWALTIAGICGSLFTGWLLREAVANKTYASRDAVARIESQVERTQTVVIELSKVMASHLAVAEREDKTTQEWRERITKELEDLERGRR